MLDESEQQESLLSRYGRSGLSHLVLESSKEKRTRRRVLRRGRQMRDQARGSGNAELMYEMEGGYKDDSSRSSSQSVELKQERRNTSVGISIQDRMNAVNTFRNQNHSVASS